jgi:hypothetical protein
MALTSIYYTTLSYLTGRKHNFLNNSLPLVSEQYPNLSIPTNHNVNYTSVNMNQESFNYDVEVLKSMFDLKSSLELASHSEAITGFTDSVYNTSAFMGDFYYDSALSVLVNTENSCVNSTTLSQFNDNYRLSSKILDNKGGLNYYLFTPYDLNFNTTQQESLLCSLNQLTNNLNTVKQDR